MAETDRIEKKHKKSKEARTAPKDETSITFYLHASLFLFFLISYTFLLFLYENQYPLIIDNEILPEILFACFGFLVFSFFILFLLSFWRFLARIFIAAVAGGAVAYILGLLLPVNIGNYLVHFVSFLPQGIQQFIAAEGNMLVALASGVVFFIMLNIFKGGAMAFLSLPVLVALFMLLNSSSKQVTPAVRQNSLPVADEAEKTDNLIYLILADHTGYSHAAESWQMMNSKAPAPAQMPNNPTFINSFYLSNKFVFYPSAYLRYQDRYRNIGNILNPSLTEIDNSLFNRDDAAYYVSSEDAAVYITRNDLFKDLKAKGYRLNVYQTYPFDFCKGAGVQDVDRCYSYPAPMGALYQASLTTGSRLLLLFGHWINSTPFGKGAVDFVYGKLKNRINTSSIPFLGNPLSHSLPVGQSSVLARLRRDVLDAKGKNVFFAHLDLPHYPYAYDKYCRLKTDPMSWRSAAPYRDRREMNGELKRWEDYNQQLACTYGQINYLMKELESAKLLDKTRIVIHGDKGAGIKKEIADQAARTRVDAALDLFKSNMSTTFAIYTPQNKKGELKTRPCDVATLVGTYLMGISSSACVPPDFTSYTKEEEEKSMAWLASPVSGTYLAPEKFEKFYGEWSENGGQAYMAALDERLKLADNAPKDDGKISFVAPPAFMEKTDEAASKDKKSKKTSFVPVPEEKAAEKPVPESKPADEAKAVPEKAAKPQEVPAGKEKTAKKEDKPEKSADKKAEKAPAEKAAKTGEAEKTEKAEKPKAVEPVVDLIEDDADNLPKPIALPEIDSEFAATAGWKLDTTPVEGMPPVPAAAVDTAAAGEPVPAEPAATLPEPAAALPDNILEELTAPAAAPVPDAAVIDLPPLDLEIPAPVAAVQEDVKLPVPEPAAEAVLPVIEAAGVSETEAVALPDLDVIQSVSVEEIKQLPALDVQPDIKAPEEAKTGEEAKAKTEEEAKPAVKVDAAVKTDIAAEKAKAEAEVKAKAEEEVKAKTEEEAKPAVKVDAAVKTDIAAEKAKAETDVKAKAEEEVKAKTEEETKPAVKVDAAVKTDIAAEKAKAEAEVKAKAEADVKAKAEEEAKAKAAAEAKAAKEAKLKAEKEAKAKKAAEEKAKKEAAAKARAEKEAKLKAEEKARAEKEAEAKAKAAQEAIEKAIAEAEARDKAAEAARAAEEAARKKAPPPPPVNVDELDITKEIVTEKMSSDGEVETYIFIERKPNPNRFKRENTSSKERLLQQQDLIRLPPEQKKQDVPAAQPKAPAPVPVIAVPVSESGNTDEDVLLKEEVIDLRIEKTTPAPAAAERVLGGSGAGRLEKKPAERVLE